MATVFNALHGVNEYGEEITYRLNGSIDVKGFPEVGLQEHVRAHGKRAARRHGRRAFAWRTLRDTSTTILTMLPR